MVYSSPAPHTACARTGTPRLGPTVFLGGYCNGIDCSRAQQRGLRLAHVLHSAVRIERLGGTVAPRDTVAEDYGSSALSEHLPFCSRA